jgi:hypothetical protein
MKKLLYAVAFLTVAVLGVSLVFGKKIVLALSSPETKACAKLGDLCGQKGDAHALDQCVDGLHEARKIAGSKSVDKSLSCIQGSDTCMAATGCMMGGVGVGAMKEMVKGFADAVSK